MAATEAFNTLLPTKGDTIRTLESKILQVLTGTTSSSGGTLLTGAVVAGSGAPTHTPVVPAQLYFDTANNGQQYEWFGGAWSP